MGRQTGPVYRTGTIGPVTYYKLFGEHYYLRSRSTLKRKRFFNDPAFEGSRKRSREFGGAAGLAAALYKHLPRQNRGRGFMGKLIGQVHKALLARKTKEAILQDLLLAYGGKKPDTKNIQEVDIKMQKEEVPIKSNGPRWVMSTTPLFPLQNSNDDKDITLNLSTDG